MKTKQSQYIRRRLLVAGQVQGVGFRPFIYRLAVERGLLGHVGNTSSGVCIEIQGEASQIEAFLQALHHSLPPLAKLTSLSVTEMALQTEEKDFFIEHSEGSGGHTVLISPDTGLCEQCQKDMEDNRNRRHAYPFTNCTNCGPRYTITKSIPYDRATTSMHCFPLCATCQEEYDNPLDRRFHAQPNACPVCGPEVWTVPAIHAVEAQCTDLAGVLLQQKQHCTHQYIPQQAQGQAQEHSQEKEQQQAQQQNQCHTGQAALAQVATALLAGSIVAIKGLGGFHLACSAFAVESIARLRERKQRPHKPLAIMVPHVSMAHALAHIHSEEEQLLTSIEKPIVLCKRKSALPNILAPDTDTIGLVLPYTPLHKALFMHLQKMLPSECPLALVMTSGNAGGEPICLGNREALHRLSAFADLFLLHNRDILVRTDDSVCAAFTKDIPWQVHMPDSIADLDADMLAKKSVNTQQRTAVFFRRARGYVPRPTVLGGLEGQDFAEEVGTAQDPTGTKGTCAQHNPKQGSFAPQKSAKRKAFASVLGMGAELKNTVCLSRKNMAFVSQHIGDMHNLHTLAFQREVVAHLEMLLQVRPQAVVHDLHPNFLSTQAAQEYAAQRDIPCFALQHHYAHAYAVLAEHQSFAATGAPCLALALDGTGYGEDGTIWGGEVLYIDTENAVHQRMGRLSPFALMGGEQAIKDPWRLALTLAHGTTVQDWLCQEPLASVVQVPMLLEMLAKAFPAPMTSSVGRLFDAVSAGLGLCPSISYEGQAAILLEHAQKNVPWKNLAGVHRGGTSVLNTKMQDMRVLDKDLFHAEHLVCHVDGLWEISSQGLFVQTLEQAQSSSVPLAARAFHVQLAAAFVQVAQRVATETQVSTVVICGGVVQNSTLYALLSTALRAAGLTVLCPQNMPSNDGAISLGQVYYGCLQKKY